MLLLYISGIRLYNFIIWIFSFFNKKAKLFCDGRKDIFETIAKAINRNDKHVWFHFASLGEFEQGRPVLERLKAQHPEKKIIVTFFSPSGYEIRKNYALADVFYLPMDSARNAATFLDLINPELVIFTKYEFWYFYFRELKKRQIPLYVISGIFRPKQAFFKWYGQFYRNILHCVTHFFVQNTESKTLLNAIGISEVSISGDTRFDRVYENAMAPRSIAEIEAFVGTRNCLVCGSTWPDDEKILTVLPAQFPEWKFIIAPHEIHGTHISEIEKLFPKAVRFSDWKVKPEPSSDQNILIIDNIGMLSALYSYGKVAYIGGGFGTGIHNTLEAAAFGLPVIFGPNYDKFQEAKDLLQVGAAKSISSADELLEAFRYFISNDASSKARDYVEEKKGATDMILKEIE
ncbi:3-deoxy-D-manno-octulosonic acid transferase [Pedobacter sp. AW1-32]|uniref:3-deoxy-D-manno-octulosonic acid transferase n=1 Tax=Pedobacter sp. AW1-32 TaxID=3383026 RepID=UPI003FF0DC55